MKYIVYNDQGAEEIILFSEIINHSTMSKRMGGAISAGFAYKDDYDNVYCTGKSHTLNMDSRPDKDTELLIRRLTR